MPTVVETEEESTRSANERENESVSLVDANDLSTSHPQGNVNGQKWVVLQAMDCGDGSFESEFKHGAWKTTPRDESNFEPLPPTPRGRVPTLRLRPRCATL